MTTAGANTLEQARRLLQARDVPAAILAFDSAERCGASPDNCAGGRWIAHMLRGNFAAAWRESDAIRRRAAADPNRLWSGENLRGRRLIVRCLHGYGDAVQFLRYAPRLRALASHLVVEVAPPMVGMASCIDGIDDVITWGPGAPASPPNWDVQVEVMELPYLFRTQPHQLPLAAGYLHLPGSAKRHAAQAISSAGVPRVGVVWAAGDWNPERSLPLSLLQPLLRVSQCEFWNLQGGRAGAEWTGARDAACCGDGIVALAAAIEQLDLVITVDTLAAHLAGALQKRAWVLLPYAADWRWQLGRSDSPWYPSLRLFRQPVQGDWESTICSVQQELARWLTTRAA